MFDLLLTGRLYEVIYMIIEDDYVIIYRAYIMRKGKKIPPPAGQSAWKLKIPKDKFRGS
ncbi:MAG: hypothetical protein AAF541_23480 [Pseudomonadota bacterium]